MSKYQLNFWTYLWRIWLEYPKIAIKSIPDGIKLIATEFVLFIAGLWGLFQILLFVLFFCLFIPLSPIWFFIVIPMIVFFRAKRVIKALKNEDDETIEKRITDNNRWQIREV